MVTDAESEPESKLFGSGMGPSRFDMMLQEGSPEYLGNSPSFIHDSHSFASSFIILFGEHTMEKKKMVFWEWSRH